MMNTWTDTLDVDLLEEFAPFTGRPTPGNKILDKMVSESAESLAGIAAAVLELRKAKAARVEAVWAEAHCRQSLCDALQKYFTEYGGWNAEKASKAVTAFEKSGFGSAKARKLAAFVRYLFFDDESPAFQAVDCIGLAGSRMTSGGVIATFEDSRTGNQFSFELPFVGGDDESKLYGRSSLGVVGGLHFTLYAPDEMGDSRIVAKSYDVRAMRAAVFKFVSDGCKLPACRPVEVNEYVEVDLMRDSFYRRFGDYMCEA